MTDFIVLGAGMVGVSTALALQARGHAVALVDQSAPGRETSYGNAGIIQSEAVEPYALPRRLLKLAAAALGAENQVNWRLSGLPHWGGALWRYWRHSAPAPHRRASAVYARLAQAATGDHAPLVAQSGAEALIRREGFRQIYRDPRSFAAARAEAARLARDYGVASLIEDSAALARAEPELRLTLSGAILWRDPWSCADPGALVAAYAALFAARGGTVLTGDAASLARHGAAWQVRTSSGPLEAGGVVLALGPWTPQILRPFGLRVPMVLKRGYHRHFTGAGPRIPLMDTAHSTVIAPMRQGVRVLTGADLARIGEPHRPAQLTRGSRAAQQLFALEAPVEAAAWAGYRPCLPRMLPIVGAAPGVAGMWLNFGHGHQGFTLGPTTARLLADVVAGEGRGELHQALAFAP